MKLNKNESKKFLTQLKASGVKNITLESFLNSNTKNKKKIEFNSHFKAELSSEVANEYKIIFYGKHYSKNVIQNWHRGILLKYKKGIKLASSMAFVCNKKFIPKEPLTKVFIEMIVYNPKSRDDDANYDTLKWMRDTLTVNKLILDDNRKVVIDRSEQEIISKEYKIELIVKDLSV